MKKSASIEKNHNLPYFLGGTTTSPILVSMACTACWSFTESCRRRQSFSSRSKTGITSLLRPPSCAVPCGWRAGALLTRIRLMMTATWPSTTARSQCAGMAEIGIHFHWLTDKQHVGVSYILLECPNYHIFSRITDHSMKMLYFIFKVEALLVGLLMQ